MFVSIKKYNEISKQLNEVTRVSEDLDREKNSLVERNKYLNQEVKRLANIISASNTECKIGPWCEDCKHIRSDRSVTPGLVRFSNGRFYTTNPFVEGEIMYCAKHLHDLCPEHSKNNQVSSISEEDSEET